MVHPANIGRGNVIYPHAPFPPFVVVDPEGYGDVRTIAEGVRCLLSTTIGTGTLYLAPGDHYVDSTIALPRGIKIIGSPERISNLGTASIPASRITQRVGSPSISLFSMTFAANEACLVFEDVAFWGLKQSILFEVVSGTLIDMVFSRTVVHDFQSVFRLPVGVATVNAYLNDSTWQNTYAGWVSNPLLHIYQDNSNSIRWNLTHSRIQYFSWAVGGGGRYFTMDNSTLLIIGLVAEVASYNVGGVVAKSSYLQFGNSPYVATNYIGYVSAFDCTFYGNPSTFSYGGNRFVNCHFGQAPAHISSTGNIVVGCDGMELWTEDGVGADAVYAGCTHLAGLPWPGFGPVVLGDRSILEGQSIRAITANYALDHSYIDRTLLVNAASNPITVTLPPAASMKHAFLVFKRIDTTANAVVIDADGAELIDGNLTVGLDHYLDTLAIQSDGTAWRVIHSRNALTHEPMGFPVSDDTYTTFSWNNATKVMTIAPVGATFDVWVKGVLFRKGSTTKSIAATVAEGIWYFYFDGAGVFQGSQTPYVFSEHAPVVIGYYDATAANMVLLFDERHAAVMDWSTHEYLHETRGLAIVPSGFGLSGSITGSGAADADAQVGMSGGEGHDEDLEVPVTDGALGVRFRQPLSAPSQIPVYYRTGAALAWRKKTANTFPVLEDGANRIKYNLNTAGTWTQPNVTINGRHMAMWICATNNYSEPIIAILGQREDTTLANAQLNNTFASLDLAGLPTQELKVLWRVIFQTATTYANVPHARIRDITDYRSSISLPSGGPSVTAHNALTGRDIYAVHPRPAIQMPVATVTTTPITLSSSYDVVLVDTTVGDITLNLPPAADYVDRSFTILKKTSDLNTVIVEPDGAETVNGQPNLTLASQWAVARVVSDGTAWFVI